MERTCFNYINAEGWADSLPLCEVEATEVSGRSTWQRYAMEPDAVPPPLWKVVPLMRCRPGAIMPGLWPAAKRAPSMPYAPCTPQEIAMLHAARNITINNLRVIMGRSGRWVNTMRQRWECTSLCTTSGNTEQELTEARNIWRNLSR